MRVLKNFTLTTLLFLFLSSVVFAQKPGKIKGLVRLKSNGKVAANVKVTARKDGKNIKSTRTRRNGKFLLTGLQPGKYNLVFDKNGYSEGVLYGVLVKSKKTNNLEKKRIFLSIDEGTLVIVKGSVFDQSGRSVYGAKVRIEQISSEGVLRKLGPIYTSRSGEFTFRFPEGKKKFRVTANLREFSASKEIEVEEPAIYRLAITLNLPVKKKK